MIATLTPNVPLLKITLSHVVMHMRQWDQGAWSIPTPACGTAHCYGGWAIILHGGHFLRLPDGGMSDLFVIPKPGESLEGLTTFDIAGETAAAAHDYARHILRLSEADATRLFRWSNELDDQRRIVAELCTAVAA